MTVTVWILGDQLLLDHPAITLAEDFGRDQIVILFIESESRSRRYHYQAKKLVLLFSAMRHFSEMLRSNGYQVDYRISSGTSMINFGVVSLTRKPCRVRSRLPMTSSKVREALWRPLFCNRLLA